MSSIEGAVMSLYADAISRGGFTPDEIREVGREAIDLSRRWDSIRTSGQRVVLHSSQVKDPQAIVHGLNQGCGAEATQVSERMRSGRSGKWFGIIKVTGKKSFASLGATAWAALTFNVPDIASIGMRNLQSSSFLFWHVVTAIVPIRDGQSRREVGYQVAFGRRHGLVLDTWNYNLASTKKVYTLAQYADEWGHLMRGG